jgi:chromosome segregation ATPase
MVLSFETLMSMAKSWLERRGLAESAGELRQKLDDLEQQFDQRQAEYQTEVDRQIKEFDRLRTTHQAEIDRLQDQIGQLQTELETKRAELRTSDRQQIIIAGVDDPTTLTKAERLPLIEQLLTQQVPEQVILSTFGIHQKTLDRYRTELNGRLGQK